MDDRSVPEWVEMLGALAGQLQHQRETSATLQTIVAGAVDMVPGARWAGVSVVTDGRVETEAATGPIIGELDHAQTSLDEGPWEQALRRHRSVHVADMSTDARWPRLGQAAVRRGVRSALWLRLFATEGRLAVLTIYGDEPGVFAANSLLIGDVLAQHASFAMLGAEAEDQFNQALASRDLIGQAKGLLMHERKLNGLQAFELLIKTSQNANIKLVEVARWLVSEHEATLPTENPAGE
ncbi:GAF and ANTAR domain-containing protein [Mycobacterium sp. NPDC003323]